MSDRDWTPEQRDAIDARAGTLIVSAAAGSGKTAVLIQRIIERLTDAENPCDADKLLIVTFTRAATAEMRARLTDAIADALKKDPENESLRRQQMLIPSANIFTIDAFCSKIIKENFESLGIAPDYTMLDESESKILKKQAIDTVIEELYAENSVEFCDLVELLFTGRSDASLEENILKLYTYSRAYASPTAWLISAAEIYNSEGGINRENPIIALLIKNSEEYISYLKEILTASIDEINASPELIDCESVDTLKEDLQLCEVLKELLNDLKFDEILEFISSTAFSTWRAPKGYKDAPEILRGKDVHATIRSSFKPDGEISKLICETESEFLDDLSFLYPIACKLVGATLRFSEEYMSLKTQKNAYDFSDVTHFALKLLVQDLNKPEITRTELAIDISKNFEEILIDEYQDTNKAQDMIFRAVSRDENNLFMVGDVKQSIYGFRQAMPDIFLEKKNSFSKYEREKDEYPACVTLGKNFRSREGVTKSVNFVFSQIMSSDCGDITYDKNEELVFGAGYYAPITEPETELCLIQTNKGDDTLEAEAHYISKYIIDQVENNGAGFGDFAILLRTVKGHAQVMEKVFNSYSIPVCTDTGDGFLDTTDVQVIVSLLKIIDNPLNDIPLMSILLSEIFAFTPADVSRLRIGKKDVPLFSCLLDGEQAGDEKCMRLCKALRHYRRLSVSLPAGELIRQIYDDTLYPEIISSLKNGQQRYANLMLLQTYADKFDSADSFGISGFVRYLDKLKENNASPAGAISSLGADNYVKIMSIHKSKGLEFKYCILADTTRKFNRQDLNAALILNPKHGMGIKGRDISTGNTYPSIVHSVIKSETEKSVMSETVRVLYVALTRAKEHLVIVGATDTAQNKLADKAIAVLSDTTAIHPYRVRKAGSFLDWLLPALIRHPACKPLRDISSLHCNVLPADFELKFSYIDYTETNVQEVAEDAPKDQAKTSDAIDKIQAEITARINYVYPYLPLSSIATKRAASHSTTEVFEAEYFATAVPEFVSSHGLTPAQRGTCLHKFMQYANLSVAEQDLEFECTRLVSAGFLTEAELKAVDKEKVTSFLRSQIYNRIKASSDVMREKKFSILVPAGTYNPELPADLGREPVLIQGIADCVFRESDGLVILDYKTDRETDESSLVNKHKDQLTTYAHALSQCLGTPVKEAYIYAFSLDKELKVI